MNDEPKLLLATEVQRDIINLVAHRMGWTIERFNMRKRQAGDKVTVRVVYKTRNRFVENQYDVPEDFLIPAHQVEAVAGEMVAQMWPTLTPAERAGPNPIYSGREHVR